MLSHGGSVILNFIASYKNILYEADEISSMANISKTLYLTYLTYEIITFCKAYSSITLFYDMIYDLFLAVYTG